jgi:hypothetical protein
MVEEQAGNVNRKINSLSDLRLTFALPWGHLEHRPDSLWLLAGAGNIDAMLG